MTADPHQPDGDQGSDEPADPTADQPVGGASQPAPDPAADPAATTAGPVDAPAGVSSSPVDAALEGEDWAGPRRRRRSPSSSGRSSSAARTRRHRGAVAVHVVLGILGLGLAWVVVTGLLAALQLSHARSDLSHLRSGIASGDTDVQQTADSLAAHAHHAAVLTRGPAWATLAAIPYVGDPFDAIRGIATSTSTLVDGAAPGLVAVADDVNPRSVVKGGTVDIAALQRAAAPVRTATAVVGTADNRVALLPGSTWLPFVDSATSQLSSQLHDLDHTLTVTDKALQVLPSMLGGDGRARRYFVAVQNNAELRGTGGLPGAFAIVSTVDGKVSIERFESDTLFAGTVPTGLDFGAAYNTQYGGDTPYTQYIDSNESPNFPYAAQIWCAMWTQVSGEELDGALTVDPAALSYLLAATGPATAPDGTQITSANVVSLLQKDVYTRFPQADDNPDRRAFTLNVAQTVEKKILAGAGNSRALLQGLSRSVDERRILAWTKDPAAQQVLAGAAIGGTVPATDQPYSQLSLNNGAGGKLDYYLGRSVTWARTGCGDTRDVTVTITLKNNAPASGLPPYVTLRMDKPTFATVPGQNRTVIDYVATDGAQLLGATLDGKASGAGVFDEQGHPVFRTTVELKPGASTTWVLRLQEPAGTAPVTVVEQPGVLPLQTEVDDRSCG